MPAEPIIKQGKSYTRLVKDEESDGAFAEQQLASKGRSHRSDAPVLKSRCCGRWARTSGLIFVGLLVVAMIAAAIYEGALPRRRHMPSRKTAGLVALHKEAPLPQYCSSGGLSGPGYSNAVTFRAALLPQPALTIAAKIRADHSDSYQVIAGWSSVGSKPKRVELRLSPWGNIEYSEEDVRANMASAIPSINLADSKWHDISVTRSSWGMVRLHADGQLVGEGVVPPTAPAGLAPIARSARGMDEKHDYVLNGDVQDLRIFDTELNSTDLGLIEGPCRVAVYNPRTTDQPVVTSVSSPPREKAHELKHHKFIVKIHRDSHGDSGYSIMTVNMTVSSVVRERQHELRPMRAGDLILAVNGQPIANVFDYQRLAMKLQEYDLTLQHPEDREVESTATLNGIENLTTRHQADGRFLVRADKAQLSHQMLFPISFENEAEGSCPSGWTCSTNTERVCKVGSHTKACLFPDVKGIEGQSYFVVGDDDDRGSASSPAFVLPPGVDRITFRRSGGAGVGSGLYVRSRSDDRLLCSAENGRDTNSFFLDSCGGLSEFEGRAVTIVVRDMQNGPWAKVLVDDIQLKTKDNQTLPSAVLEKGEAALRSE